MNIKKIVIGTGVASAIAAFALLGSTTLHRAYAAESPATVPTASTTTADQTGPNDPADAAGQTEATGPAETTDPAESAALQAQAKITADQAKAAALAQVPGATVTSATLEDENGVVVYNVQLTDTAGKPQEVKVDAVTGKIVPADASGANDQSESQSGTDTGGAEAGGTED